MNFGWLSDIGTHTRLTLLQPPARLMTITDPSPSPVAGPGRLHTGPVVAPAPALAIPRRRSWVRRLAAPEGLLVIVAVGAAGVGLGLRFVSHSSLWLDEALTVNISRLSLPRLFDALRHDGAPPAYYVLLHFWMRLFGTGDTTVRTLPALLSALTVPVAYLLGRAVGGRKLGLVAAVFLATSPFAIRYGSENRMYALVMLLAALGGLALVASLRDPTPGRLISVGLISGLLLLTHYWTLYLVVAAAAVLLIATRSGTNRTASRLTLAALASGALLFGPWLPTFVFQAGHTGTPWATAPSPMMLVDALGQFVAWHTPLGRPLFALYCVLLVCLLAVVTISTLPAGRRLGAALGLRSRVPGERWAGPVAAVVFGTLTLALVGGLVTGAAFAYRYASVILPGIILLAAMGATALGVTLGGRHLRAAMMAGVAVLGVPVGAQVGLGNRTEASVVAERIRSIVRPGDVIAYCPDQLGPAVSRLLPSRYIQVTFPRFDPPEFVNWVDYSKVNAAAPLPGVFARELVNLAGAGHPVWLVWEPGYRTFGHQCEQLRDSLVALRPNFSEPVRSHPDRYYEHESLDRFAPA